MPIENDAETRVLELLPLAERELDGLIAEMENRAARAGERYAALAAARAGARSAAAKLRRTMGRSAA